jgi:beta-glucosidase
MIPRTDKEYRMIDSTFPEDFLWGAATASFQVEGAGREDGRGESIWDRFCRTPGKVHAGDNGDVAADQYHRFEEDIALMKAAGIQSYRFSIAWPRIIPAGTGAVNPAGIAYYQRLTAALKKAGIKPVATLYHWDLPQPLEDAGGWTNRKTAEAFAEFARVCFEALGTEIETWITLNEPFCSAYLGYLHGVHAPGRTEPAAAYRAVHHLNLAHGLALRAFRRTGLPGTIGIVWNPVNPRPATRSDADRRAMERVIDHDTRVFTSPVLGKGYPSLLGELGIALPIEAGDMEIIAGRIDFIGINFYAERPVRSSDANPLGAEEAPSWQSVTDMGWPVVPGGLLRLLHWMAAEAPGIPLYITENGSAEADEVVLESDSRRVHDVRRIDYLRSHFAACSRAIAEGVPLKGYYVWSFIDNFEWSYGYAKRFGIVHCDFSTLERIPKDSYYYYRDVIAGYGD